MKEKIAPVVNIFPDASPHAHGERLKAAVGVYDLVISSKKYHPPIWKSVYGYDNPCIFVPHGYIPSLHLRHAMSENYSHDVVLIATARSEYFNLMRDLVGSLGPGVRLAICGSGWERQNMGGLGIDVGPEKHGQAYVEWLRRAKITLSPIQTSVNVGSTVHQGDEVTTRTFQCAAAYTFFIHRRTAEVKTYYDEATEVPMYDNPAELADQIRYYLAHDEKRKTMAAAAHARAVPAYSLDAKAAEIRPWLERVIKRQLLSRPAASASGESLR
jgi:spore maturation protein CgeB